MIIAKLKELGIYENTIIVFTSDNGPHQEGGADPEYFDSNGVLRGLKRDVYEGGIRVPMLVHWLGKITPRTTDHISAFWDFVPTFAELIQASTPSHIDGISMIPTLFNNGEQRKHPHLYWEFHEQGGKQAVRKENWKFVKLQVNDSTNVHTELYDLKNDEGETMNLVDAHPEKVVEFEVLLKKVRTTNPVFKFAWE